LIYFIEQIILISLIFKFRIYTHFWASTFAVLVVTTASSQKLTYQSRLRTIDEATTEQRILLERASKINQDLVERNEKLEERIKDMKEFIDETL